MLNIAEWSKGISKHEFAACLERLGRRSAEEFFILMDTEALLPLDKEHHSLLLKAVVLYLCIMGQHKDKKTSEWSVSHCSRRPACQKSMWGSCRFHDEDKVSQLYKNVVCSQKNNISTCRSEFPRWTAWKAIKLLKEIIRNQSLNEECRRTIHKPEFLFTSCSWARAPYLSIITIWIYFRNST